MTNGSKKFEIASPNSSKNDERKSMNKAATTQNFNRNTRERLNEILKSEIEELP